MKDSNINETNIYREFHIEVTNTEHAWSVEVHHPRFPKDIIRASGPCLTIEMSKHYSKSFVEMVFDCYDY